MPRSVIVSASTLSLFATGAALANASAGLGPSQQAIIAESAATLAAATAALSGAAALDAAADEAKPASDWKFALSLGITGSKNDEASNWDLRTAAEAKRETETDRTTVSGEFYYKSADGTETDNNLLVKVLEEFLFKDSKWEGFAQITYQNDNFQAWEQRIGGYAGPGYRLIDDETLKLKLKGGAGASYEFPTSDWTPELLFGNDLVWTINDRALLKQGFEIYPDLNEFGEYRFIFRIEFETALSEKRDLMATVGFRDEYDSYVEADGGTSNDMKIFVGLKYAF